MVGEAEDNGRRSYGFLAIRLIDTTNSYRIMSRQLPGG